jgi:L-fuculose-phosphate aldolase
MVLAEQRADVAQACRALLAAGLVRGTSGNVSIRHGAQVAVSPTALAYSRLQPEDVPVVGLDASPVDGRTRPTSELALHLAIYRARAEVGAVVHTHSVFATVFAVLGEQIPAVHYQLARAGGEVPVAGYARYGSEELAQRCVLALADRRAVLLAHHGVVAVGPDLPEAMAVAESVEYVAELAYRARLLGGGRVLDAPQLAEAAESFRTYRQPDGPL